MESYSPQDAVSSTLTFMKESLLGQGPSRGADIKETRKKNLRPIFVVLGILSVIGAAAMVGGGYLGWKLGGGMSSAGGMPAAVMGALPGTALVFCATNTGFCIKRAKKEKEESHANKEVRIQRIKKELKRIDEDKKMIEKEIFRDKLFVNTKDYWPKELRKLKDAEEGLLEEMVKIRHQMFGDEDEIEMQQFV